MTCNRELFTRARRSTGLSVVASAGSVGTLIATLQLFPRNRFACGEHMTQSTSKSTSCLEIWGTLEVSAPQDTNASFRAWSTLALLDYVQNETPLSTDSDPDPSTEGNRSQIDQRKEVVRVELQELLRRAYAESWKAHAGQRNKNE